MRRTLVALLFSTPAVVTAAVANVTGPPPARTGGFGEATCHECHFDGPLNGPGGELSIDGVPAAYEPGLTYSLRVRVTHELLKRAGFELSARFAAGPEAGAQAGQLRLAPEIGATTVANDVVYAHHVASGTVPDAPGDHGWTIEWTAPARAHADVVLNVTANAANDDNSEFGDRIYAAELIVPLRAK